MGKELRGEGAISAVDANELIHRILSDLLRFGEGLGPDSLDVGRAPPSEDQRVGAAGSFSEGNAMSAIRLLPPTPISGWGSGGLA